LGLFAKHWTPGHVKTRLAAGIGTVAATGFHRHCVRVMLQRLQSVADARVVCYWPPEHGEQFSRLGDGKWRFSPQVPGDLGIRMAAYFQDCFDAGYQRVLLMGTDSPNIPLPYLQRAIELLETRRLILGPTDDGGYYLVGARDKVPPIFEEMPWSSPRLWSATLRRLEASRWQPNVDYEFLPAWYDVDTIYDLKRLYRELLGETANDSLTDLRRHVETALKVKPASSISRP
jgi:rSAM/selenodomain-associated transferase 1